MPQGTAINSGAYCTTLQKLRRVLQNKRRGMLSKGVLLLHGNARSHTSRTTLNLIESFGWEVLDHTPYSPDLAPSDIHLFQYLSYSLGGKHFSDNVEVKEAVNSWLSNQAADFFEEGFQNLVLSCKVIYSQFGLAIHQNDHQARRRFVEWAQNEIAVVPDFHKRILFSDESHFWWNGYVNKQNCRIWTEANPQVYVETPLHPEKLTVWCALWAGGILLQKR
ncbi:mariner Mos1 transposase [Trichonephila clavipes]|nr:mariner Mos1 transposase [Trichonephila clavipes]